MYKEKSKAPVKNSVQYNLQKITRFKCRKSKPAWKRPKTIKTKILKKEKKQKIVLKSSSSVKILK